MSGNAKAVYRVREFAERSGVTVRALHHYDRLGLLKPRRSASGYRVYTDGDLERLEHIVALKFLGLSLAQIANLLAGSKVRLREVLSIQRQALSQKRSQIEKALAVISDMQSGLADGQSPAATQWKQIIEVFQMDQNDDWTSKYYSEEAKAKLDARRSLWSPELQERVSRQWNELIAEVEAAKSDEPHSERAQSLAARWVGLVAAFTGGDASITEGLRKLYADRESWPNAARTQMQPFSISPEARAFINAAIAHRKTKV